YFAPHAALALKPLGDGFISLIKALVAPVVFLTVVLGIAGAADVKKAGRVGFKSLVYFEVVSTFALALGLLLVHLLRPGAGFNVERAALDPLATVDYIKQAQSQSVAQFLLHLIPKSFADAFTGGGDLLQVLLLAVLFVVGVLGVVARLAGFSIFSFLRYVREELLLVLGTSSSESALAPLMQKLERLGCSRSVVGLVVPSGYSFNLDGTNLYLTIAAL